MFIIDLDTGNEIVSRAVQDKIGIIDKIKVKFYNWTMRGVVIERVEDE